MESSGSNSTALTTRESLSPSRQEAAALHRPSNLSSTCVSCRNKHLKCDGSQPCSRCSVQNSRCVYLPSRRGYKRPSGNSKKSASLNEPPNDAEAGSHNSADVESASTTIGLTPQQGAISSSQHFHLVSKNWHPAGQSSRALGGNFGQRCVEAFFQYFYNSHPFLPPRHELLQILQTNPMKHLEAAICFIGSRYIPGGSSTSVEEELESLMSTSDSPRDASMVQAMLLYALGLDGNNDQNKAADIHLKAENLALELGMNQQEYAVINGLGSPIYEESLRRTWWELYVVRVMIAGFHQRSTFYFRDIISTVPLPCEEKEFTEGFVAPLHTIDEFENSWFGNEDVKWSSYTYRIAAARNLERILQSNELTFPDDPRIDKQDAYLANWGLDLPDSKKAQFDIHGGFDEMLFQAQLITSVSSILLHRRHSKLENRIVQPIISCTGQPPPALGSGTENIHTIKTVQAASNITKLITLPTPLIRHTHFFICAITLASIVQLSLWSGSALIASDHDLKQQIRMDTGALRAMAGVWPSAKITFNQVTKVAQKIFVDRKNAVDEALWHDLLDDDIMWSLAEDISSVDSPSLVVQ